MEIKDDKSREGCYNTGIMPQEPNNQTEWRRRPEVALTPETEELVSQRIDERQEKPLAEQQIEPSATPVPPLPPPSTQGEATLALSQKDPDLTAIESILSDGLAELYRGMSSSAQDKFRVRGEQAASKIREIITRAKLRARKVATLIRGWLRMIPGVSHFFLEQETKIKTDRIMEYSEKRKGE